MAKASHLPPCSTFRLTALPHYCGGSGRSGTSRSHSPLRTVHEPFNSHGSSVSEGSPGGAARLFVSYAAIIARYSRADRAGKSLLSLLCRRRQK